MASRLGVGTAPGKIILFGEHAVVYTRPALAVPVTQVQALAEVWVDAPGSGLSLVAVDLGAVIRLEDARPHQPLALAARLALSEIGVTNPDWRLTVSSTIPVASGLGSGAAVSAAVIRALAGAAGRSLDPGLVSRLVYEVEKLHHGTPSGVDNTVIAFNRPVYYVRDRSPELFEIGEPFQIAIADTGISSPTHVAVGEVRRAWQLEPLRLERIFDRIATIVLEARRVISAGSPHLLGPLMDENQLALQELGVSCAELERLAAAARAAGALGAKLSGAGRGGNLIALVDGDSAQRVAAALRAAGAARVILTWVGVHGASDESAPA